MDTFNTKIIKWWRKVRDVKLRSFALFFLKYKMTPNVMTTISLIFGLFTVYFLFIDYWLFFTFAVLHLLADMFDGIMARETKTTTFGCYFDHFTDRSVELLVLIKIAWFLQDYYVYVAIGLFLVAQTVYIISRMKAPILFSRAINLGWLALNLPILAYLTTGVTSLYALALQLQWYLKK